MLVCTGSCRAPGGRGSGPSSPAWGAAGAGRTRRGCRSAGAGGTGRGDRAGPSLRAEPWRPDCPVEGERERRPVRLPGRPSPGPHPNLPLQSGRRGDQQRRALTAALEDVPQPSPGEGLGSPVVSGGEGVLGCIWLFPLGVLHCRHTPRASWQQPLWAGEALSGLLSMSAGDRQVPALTAWKGPGAAVGNLTLRTAPPQPGGGGALRVLPCSPTTLTGHVRCLCPRPSPPPKTGAPSREHAGPALRSLRPVTTHSPNNCALGAWGSGQAAPASAGSAVQWGGESRPDIDPKVKVE